MMDCSGVDLPLHHDIGFVESSVRVTPEEPEVVGDVAGVGTPSTKVPCRKVIV